MTTQATPGIWEEIPTGAVVTATWKEQKIVGTMERVYKTGPDKHKMLELRAAPFGLISLDARDHWDVTYDVSSFADTIAASPVGSVFRSNTTQIVKVSKFNVTREDMESMGYEVPPTLLRITEFESIPTTTYTRVDLA